MTTTSIYDDGAEYDRLGMGRTTPDEVAFYAAHAPPGAAILELACGTGRLTVPLAGQGFDVTGIDSSPSMLTAAAATAAQAGVRPAFREADMRRFSLGRQFDLIFLPNNSLAHLHTLSDLRSCFDCVLAHLAETGRFIVDVFNPSLTLLSRRPDQRYPIAEYVRPDGTAVEVTETVRYDAATQISHALWRYRSAGQPDQVRALDLRMFFPQELDALLHHSGFDREAKYGGFDRSDFTGASRQQLVVCRRAASLSASAF